MFLLLITSICSFILKKMAYNICYFEFQFVSILIRPFFPYINP